MLVPSVEGDNKFWTDSAAALLAACLIRFNNLGDIYQALNDLKKLAAALAKGKDDAALLANSFIASVGADGKVASNVVATLATALTGWASTDVRANTSLCDFDADLIVSQPTVVVLTCPGRMRAVYASYLGATLRKLMLDLDTIGERNKGPLPMPVGVILDEFPTLGKLDSLVADVNLVRKRRISILIGTMPYSSVLSRRIGQSEKLSTRAFRLKGAHRPLLAAGIVPAVRATYCSSSTLEWDTLCQSPHWC